MASHCEAGADMTRRACLQCRMSDALPSSDYCEQCLMGEVILTVGGKLLVAFAIGSLGALVAWWMS